RPKTAQPCTDLAEDQTGTADIAIRDNSRHQPKGAKNKQMHPMIPAEYISNIIYEGPGADSLFFASGQLRELAYSVETTAESLEDELDELDENWKGSSSDLLADAVERYLQWLSNTPVSLSMPPG
ncbi:PPE domain-containing protein, partial [Klebsiella pneumoniae]|nr:PPE domain-containing protein [Klebsiella pneumoniae]